MIGAVLLLIGYVAAGLSTSLWQFALAHGLFIGLGAAAGFAPMISDMSHWFRRQRALAVAVAASGSYLAGAIWPPDRRVFHSPSMAGAPPISASACSSPST